MKTIAFVATLLAVLFACTVVYGRAPAELTKAKESFRECLMKCRDNKLKIKFCVRYCMPGKKLPVEQQNVFSDSNVLSNMPVTSEQLWSRYRAELFSFFRNGKRDAMPNLQLVNIPFPAEWDADPRLLTLIADSVPKFGAIWERTSKKFSTIYGDFINNINVKIPTVDPNSFRQIDDHLFDAEMRIDDAMFNCEEKFSRTFERASRYRRAEPNYDTFQARYCVSVDRAQKMYDMYLYQYEQQQRQQFGQHFQLFRSVAKYGQADRVGEFGYTAYGDLSRFVQNAQQGLTNAFSVKVSERTSTSTESTFSRSISAGYGGTFMGVGANIGISHSTEEMKLKTSMKEFQIEFGAGGYKAIPVSPSRKWFSPEILQKYKNGPFKRRGQKYFGRGGKAPLLPKTIFVVVAPKVTMYVTSQDAEQMSKTSQTGVQLSIGGFNFDFSQGASIKKSKETEKLFKVEIIGASTTPNIIAMDMYDTDKDFA